MFRFTSLDWYCVNNLAVGYPDNPLGGSYTPAGFELRACRSPSLVIAMGFSGRPALSRWREIYTRSMNVCGDIKWYGNVVPYYS